MNAFLEFVGANGGDIAAAIVAHVAIVAAAMLLAVPIGAAAGIGLARTRNAKLSAVGFYILGLGQTIPSLAVLALLVGPLGVGVAPAVVALTVYAMLPIARNCHTGIRSVPEASRDAARGLGMTSSQLLRKVELPLSMPFFISGLRTATVVTISAGALASRVGAGGLGDLIFDGITNFQPEKMLAGAIPTALLALTADWILGAWQKRVEQRR